MLRPLRNGVSKTAAKTRANAIVERHHQGERDEEGRNTRADPAGHDALVHDDDDRAVRQVQAVGRPAEAAQRPRVEQAQQRGRLARRQTCQQAPDGRAQHEVDPEQVVERPHRALPPDRRDHGSRRGEREPRPRPRPPSRARAHDAGAQDADREQRGEVGRRLDHDEVQVGDVRAQDPHRRHDERDGGDHDDGAPTADHQEQQREQDVQLGLDGDRPERPVGARRADEVLHQEAVDDDRPSAGRSLPRRRDDQPRHREAEDEGGPVRRDDAPDPPLGEPGEPVEPPAVAGRRQRQREAGEDDEHDDREPPVDEPGGPERCAVHRVAGERAQEDVVHHHEQRGQAADAVQAGQPLRRRAGAAGAAARAGSRTESGRRVRR